MNIADILREHADTRAEHPAIEDGERAVTYGELDGLVDNAAANLQAAGVAPGDIVAVLLNDSADHLIILCALARVGAVIFSLQAATKKEVLEQFAVRYGVKFAISQSKGTHGADNLTCLGTADICVADTAVLQPTEIGDDAPLLLLQSSGTTGAPKAFLRGHREMAIWVDRYARGHGWRADDRCLSLTRMSFNVGRSISIAMMRLGATVVINRLRSMKDLSALVNGERISYLKLTPAHVVPLLDLAADTAPLFPNLRAMVVGSAPTTHAQRLLARERLSPNFYEQLGSNEGGLLALARPEDQDAYPESVGRVVEGLEAQIVDDEDRLLPTGEVGHVRFRGDGFPTRYIDDPQATARAFRDGWFYPGDLAALNEEGYLFFKGRADGIINNAGAKFYPAEVETVLLEHHAVKEAAVFRWPHKRAGEIAVACVVVGAETSEREIQKFCRTRLAGYKLPYIVQILPELPKNPMGKILKRELVPVIERATKLRPLR